MNFGGYEFERSLVNILQNDIKSLLSQCELGTSLDSSIINQAIFVYN